MKNVAITNNGREYAYNYKSAHKVSIAKAEIIAEALTAAKHRISDGQAWHVYDIDDYDKAFYYAEAQSFKVFKGSIKEYVSPFLNWDIPG